METVKETRSEKESRIKQMKSPLVDVSGKWKLTYTPVGEQGAEGFGGLTIDPYKNPTTGHKIYRKLVDGRQSKYYMLMLMEIEFFPDTKPQDRLDVEWFINHPQIQVDGYDKLPEHYKEVKNTNARLKLVCLDQQELTQVDDEDFIDKLIGRLSVEGGPNAVGLDRLRYILADLNMMYRDKRHINNRETEKKVLRSKLKTFVRTKRENAEKVYAILENMTFAKTTFDFKEMLRLKIIKTENGMFKFNNIPISVTYAGILESWENQPTLKADMFGALNEGLKREGLN